MEKEKIIYKLTVADLQTVAKDILERYLTEKEINMLSEKIGEHIDWYNAIENAMTHLKIKT